jgi:hypothetical protein
MLIRQHPPSLMNAVLLSGWSLNLVFCWAIQIAPGFVFAHIRALLPPAVIAFALVIVDVVCGNNPNYRPAWQWRVASASVWKSFRDVVPGPIAFTGHATPSAARTKSDRNLSDGR